MISWCAFCQTWQGEVPPLESFELTHGICGACLRKGVAEDPQAITAIKPVANFFTALRAEARRGFATPAAAVLDQAAKLGIRPLELLVGMLQPALAEIGKLWTRGEVTVAAEHRFSAMVQAVTTLFLERAREGNPLHTLPPEFLLVNADGNHHALGVRVVEAFLVSHGRAVVALIPGLPATEVMGEVRALRPQILGVSVAAPEELGAVEELAAALAALPPAERPQLVVGGQAIRAGARPRPALGVQTVTELRDLLDIGRTAAA